MRFLLFATFLTTMLIVMGMSSASNAQQPTDSKFPLFAAPEAAQHHCPFDTVVWLNTTTDTYVIGAAPSGATKEQGAFMCQRDADQMDYQMQKTQ